MSLPRRLVVLVVLLAAQTLYAPVNRLARGGVALVVPLDAHIPLQPVWVVPYLLGVVWWLGTFVWGCLSFRPWLLRRFAGALLGAHAVAYTLYLVAPTFAVRPEVPGDGVWPSLVRWVYAGDRAYNACPSGHTYVSILVLLAWWHAAPRRRWAVVGFAAAVVLSTLFTGQHHLADVVGGLALGAAAWMVVGWVFPAARLSRSGGGGSGTTRRSR